MLPRCVAPAAFAHRSGAGVLVKAPKPSQDRRFDLPTIGPSTIAACGGRGARGHCGRGRRGHHRAAGAGRDARRCGQPVRHWRRRERRRRECAGAGTAAADFPGGLRGIRRSARRCADARACGRVRRARSNSRASAVVTWRSRGSRALFPIDDLAIVGFNAVIARLPLLVRRIRETVDAVLRDSAPICWSSSTARTSPIGWRGACGRPRRRFRLSITSRRRSGPGAQAVPARCAAMSITCWRCCRSSREVAPNTRRAALHLCGPSAGRARCRPAAG